MRKMILLVIITLVLINTLNTFTKAQCVPPPSGMAAWFTFDENGGTSVTNRIFGGSSGTINGSSTLLKPGKVANALFFPPNPNSLGLPNVAVTNQSKLNFGKGDFSIDAWIQLSPFQAVNIIDKRGPNGVGFQLFVFNNSINRIISGSIGLQLADTGSTDLSGFTNYLSQGIPRLGDGNWHHIAVTVKRDSPSGIRFYFDGLLVGTANPMARGGDLTNSSPLTIGPIGGGGIDELELFNRVLNPGEITALFNAQGFGKCKERTSGTVRENLLIMNSTTRDMTSTSPNPSPTFTNIYEPFNYNSGISLKTQNGGNGWNGAWTGGDNTGLPRATNSGLNYPGLNVLGNASTMSPTSISRLFSTPFQGTDGTSVRISMVIKSNINGNLPSQAILGNSGGGEKLNIGDIAGTESSAGNWGIETASGRYYSNVPVRAMEMTYLVVQIDFKAGNDEIRLWVNPPAMNNLAAGSLTTPHNLKITSDNISSLSGLFWQTSHGQMIDEIRVEKLP